MARNPNNDSGAASYLSWVGKETLETVSLFSTNGAARIPCCLIAEVCMLETFLRNHPPTFKGRYDPDGA